MLSELIEQARKEGKWLWCHYQDLWFSPDQLQAANDEGRFRWGAENWKLRDPKERLAEADDAVKRVTADRDKIAASIGNG